MAEDIAQWLEGLGLGRYAQAFSNSTIDFDVLPGLSEEDLRELGLTLGDRRRLQAAIKARVGTPGAAAPPEAERRQLTVLFCDLVGSTALSARLDPEDMRDVLRAYQEACSGVIARYDGYLAKLMGDGVYAYFGYPRAHEDDAERAINAGLGIVEAVGALEHDLKVRIGVATGTVAVGDLIGEGAAEEAAIVGEAPNLAARLQELARPGTLVVGEATLRLVGGLFETTALARRSLKGFAGEVAAWEVVRPRRTESRFEATRGEHLTALIGREEEMEILSRRWQRAKAGEGQVVLISGEAGIGKSRLARELQDRIAGEPHFRLHQQCSPYHTNSALHPVIEQLERAARLETSDDAATKLDKLEKLLSMSGQPIEAVAPLIASLLSLPTGRRYPPLDVSPQRQKELTLRALIDQLGGLARQRPVLFVCEDAHWIDPTTLELLELTIERVHETAALVIITYRPEFVAPWIGRPRVTPMMLGRLERRDCSLMVERVWARESIPQELRERIADQTDGVPLFIEELTKSVLEAALGSPEQMAAIEVPATLRDSLEARLDRLGPAKEIAQIGAAIGRTFEYRLLAQLAPLDEAALRANLDRLVGSGLAVVRGNPPESIYSFKHALIQDTAYGSLLRTRRAELHGAIARAMEQGFPEAAGASPEVLAYHHEAAGHAEQAAAYWLKAGQLSIGRAAMLEGLSHLSRGLEKAAAIGDTRVKLELEADLLNALCLPMSLVYGFNDPRVETTYRRAHSVCEQLNDPAKLFPVMYGFAALRSVQGRFEQGRDAAAEMAKLAESDGGAEYRLAASNALGYARWFMGENEAAEADFRVAVDLYDPALHAQRADAYYGGYDFGVMSNCYLALCQFSLGHPDQAKANFKWAVDHARELKRINSLCYALQLNGVFNGMLGDAFAALESADECHVLAEKNGLKPWVSVTNIVRGWAHARCGQPEQGLSELREGLELWNGLVRAQLWLPHHGMMLAEAHIAARRPLDDALAIVNAELSRIERTSQFQFLAPLLCTRGEVMAGLGRTPEAADCYGRALHIARGQSARSWELRAATRLARLWQAEGRAGEARDLLAPVYGWFTEGFETADLADAKALLDALS